MKKPCPTILETCEQILREQLPNLLRLYVNPHVTAACYCLDRYVQTTWSDIGGEECQSFLANGFDEALSGAIKLARCGAAARGRSHCGLIVDPAKRLGPYATTTRRDGARIEFVPGLTISAMEDLATAVATGGPFGFVVLVLGATCLNERANALCSLLERDRLLLITCVDRESLTLLRRDATTTARRWRPDIVIFDESFVNRAVPFSAFAARRSLYDHWNRPGKTTFHSTTYQPNTISNLHFLRCLEWADPEFYATVAPAVRRILGDRHVRGECFRRLYSPSLYRMIRAAGFDAADVRASGDHVIVDDRAIFDAVSGVACSARGHSPASYVAELTDMGSFADCHAELATRLHHLTGLEHVLPAVSGATAVENALKLALAGQFPRRHVLALQAGFGGKTLLSLTGTANSSYKEHIDPLYADVLYVDPFAPEAIARIDAALAQHPVAVVQAELIQAVGGVRRVPEAVIRHLAARRQDHGYWLLVDEVQSGMYRTGPFTQSAALGISPDFLLLGKATSDMMFPFALTLHSAAVADRLERAGVDLPAVIRNQYGYEFGYKTVLNVLRRAEASALAEHVAEAGALFAELLRDGLTSCKAVRAVRNYGLLIGIELDTTAWPQRWFRKRLYSFYLYGMLRHRDPVLAGFCQYEPNVLKITPALTVEPDAIRAACATIIDVLQRPFHRLVASTVGGLVTSYATSRFPRKNHEHDQQPVTAAHDPVAR
jgi:acetylornithine/succinyldiaminopimelate/putrescine aminotransferase